MGRCELRTENCCGLWAEWLAVAGEYREQVRLAASAEHIFRLAGGRGLPLTKPTTTHLRRGSRKRGRDKLPMCVCAGQGSGILHATPSVEDLSRLFNTCGVWETQHSPERARQRWHTWPCSQPRVPESARGPLLQATRAAGLIAVPIRQGKSLSASKLLLGNKHRHREWNMPAKYPLAGIQT